ncbi:MAG: hypothetical protein RMK45_04695 [Armatimonadota bacterium]|nr:hypothetical protein [Armatimonadota bacterium]
MNSAEPKAVVLVVDKFSQDVHIAHRVAGVKYPADYNRETQQVEYSQSFFSILADLANIQPKVRVFFYRRRIDELPEARGFIGEWEATTSPYEDRSTSLSYGKLLILGSCPNCQSPTSTLDENGPRCNTCGANLSGHILPLRFELSPINLYPRYLDDNTAYIDITDEGRLSTLIFRKITGAGRERSVNPILPEEAQKLRRLLKRVADESRNEQVDFPATQSTSGSGRPISEFLDFSKRYPLRGRGMSLLYDSQSGQVIFETILEFWLVHELSVRPQAVVQALNLPSDEEIEWFSNQVLFGIGGEKSDVLILMRDKESKIRRRAVVIELKRETVDSGSITQVKGYSYWVAQLVTAQCEVQSPFVITPVTIGHRVARGVRPFEPFDFQIPYSPQALRVQVEAPKVYTYEVKPADNTVSIKPCENPA